MNKINYHSIIYKYMWFKQPNIIKYNPITNNAIYNECAFGSMYSYYINKIDNGGINTRLISKFYNYKSSIKLVTKITNIKVINEIKSNLSNKRSFATRNLNYATTYSPT